MSSERSSVPAGKHRSQSNRSKPVDKSAQEDISANIAQKFSTATPIGVANAPLTPQNLRYLHHTVGNQFVGRFIQTELARRSNDGRVQLRVNDETGQNRQQFSAKPLKRHRKSPLIRSPVLGVQRNVGTEVRHSEATGRAETSELSERPADLQVNLELGTDKDLPKKDNESRVSERSLNRGILQALPVDETPRAAAAREPTARFLVDDDATPAAGQMRRSDFLDALNEHVCQVTDDALAGTPYTSASCPYITRIFNRHRQSDPARIEQILQRYAPESRNSAGAEEMIRAVGERTRQVAASWGEGQDIAGMLPGAVGLSGLLGGAREGLGGDQGTSVTGGLLSSIGGMFQSAIAGVLRWARPGGASKRIQPVAVMRELGTGQALPATTRNQMESAFGTSFAQVQVHTDATAAQLSRDLNARAFAVGDHIAFQQGAYLPGTLIGDALIAHELAHVEQQKGAKLYAPLQAEVDGAEEKHLEREADVTAIDVVKRVRGIDGGDRKTHRSPWKTGLSLRRCTPNVRTELGHTRTDSNVSGKKVGEWRRATRMGAVRHDLIAGDMILRAGSEAGEFEDAFETIGQASAYAHVTIASRVEDGGVIIRQDGRYRIYVVDVDPSRLLFHRQAIEEDMDTSSLLDTSNSQVAGVVAFISSDGYRVPINQEIKLNPNRLNPDAVPTSDIEMEGYEQVLQDLRQGRDLNLDSEGYVALFKGMLRGNAMRQLQENEQKLDEEQRKYGRDRSASSTAWQRLRAIIRKDQALARHEREAHRDRVEHQREAARLRQQASGQRTRAGFGEATYAQAAESQRQAEHHGNLAEQYREREEQVKQYRARLRTEYPPLSVLDTGTITEQTGNEQIFARIQAGFDEVRTIIDDVKQRIHTEDIPLSKLGPIVDQTKAQMGVTEQTRQSGDPLSVAVTDWLESRDTTEAVITWTGTILSLVLGVAAIIASGGWAIFLGLAGSAVGLGTAVYEFERAEDLYSAARAGEATGGNLVDDPEAARFNYIMGWVNLVLAGLDLGIAARAASTLVRGGRIAEHLAGSLGGDVLQRLRPEQITRFDEAMRLRRAGDAEGAQRILDRLRRQLGDEVFAEAESLFSRASKTQQFFGEMAGVSEEARRALLNLDEAILERLPALGSTSVENIGRFIHRHGTEAAVMLNRSGDDILGLAARMGSSTGGELDDIFRVFSQTGGNLRDQFTRLLRMGDLSLDTKTVTIRALEEALTAGRVPRDDLTRTLATITRAGGDAEQIALNARQTLAELQNAQRVVSEGAEGAVRVNAVADEVYDLGQGVTTTVNPMHEIDTLFLRNGTVHAHEVKDTASALLNKLREHPINSLDNQLQRMLTWWRGAPAGQSRAIQVVVRSEDRWTAIFSQVEGRTVAQILGDTDVPLRIGDRLFSPTNSPN